MARKLLHPPTATRVAAECLVQVHKLPALKMVTIDLPFKKRGVRKEPKNKFVRFNPAEGTTDAQIQEATVWAHNAGALSVQVLPVPNARVISAASVRQVMEAIEDLSGENRQSTVTEVVMELVAQANVPEDMRAELEAYCKETLEESNASDDG